MTTWRKSARCGANAGCVEVGCAACNEPFKTYTCVCTFWCGFADCPAPMPEWAVRVAGRDDLLPQPDEATAHQVADDMNRVYTLANNAFMHRPDWPLFLAVAEPWPCPEDIQAAAQDLRVQWDAIEREAS